MATLRVLFVDDEASIRETLPAILSGHGFSVTAVATVAEAIAKISQEKFDILLADLNIGQPADGFTVVSAMRRIQPAARTFILTGYPDFSTALEAIKRQVDDYLIKPADIPHLVNTLKSKLERPPYRETPVKHAPEIIRENSTRILNNWLAEVSKNPEFTRIRLSRKERLNHLPPLLEELASRLGQHYASISQEGIDRAATHGRLRREQGYPVSLVVEETRIFYKVISQILQENLLLIDISSIIPDLVQISDMLSNILAHSLSSYGSSTPVAA
ncbi:MAG TPA: response regulator [Terriglobales bacterium]|nr:response regulator [Terriglobales bacterium]